MKLTFYFDVYPWSRPGNIYVQSTPSEKPHGTKRYKIEMEIPDPAEPDETITVEAIEV